MWISVVALSGYTSPYIVMKSLHESIWKCMEARSVGMLGGDLQFPMGLSWGIRMWVCYSWTRNRDSNTQNKQIGGKIGKYDGLWWIHSGQLYVHPSFTRVVNQQSIKLGPQDPPRPPLTWNIRVTWCNHDEIYPLGSCIFLVHSIHIILTSIWPTTSSPFLIWKA